MKKIIIIILVVCFTFLAVAPVMAALSIVPTACSDSNEKTACGLCQFIEMFFNISDIIIMLSGAFSVIMIVFGGLWMITAYGNQSRIQQGKDMVIATVVGIFIVMLAWTLVNWILYSLYGQTSETTSNAYEKLTGQKLENWGYCADPKNQNKSN